MERKLKRLDGVYFLLGRCLLGLYFIVPGVLKITGFSATLAWMLSKGVPFPDVLLPLTIAMQIGLGAMLIVGKNIRLSALLLFGLTLLISIYMHNFWALDGDPNQAHELQNFIKNLGIAAGLLVLASKQGDKRPA